VEAAFDLCELAHAAGATYVARGNAWGYRQLVDVIAGGIAHKGFSMVEAMAVCPVYYGRFNLTPDPAEFLKVQKERAVPASTFEEGESRTHDQYPVGLIHHAERREFVTALEEVSRGAQEKAAAKGAGNG
jgi:2-oxoglutarate ferredoxin oxidoreductase subunit beta